MKVKARNGKTYDVSTAPPGGEHQVTLGGAAVGAFVLEADTTRVTQKSNEANETLLKEIAEIFVDQGGAPMGMM
jgi:hypothetical protein